MNLFANIFDQFTWQAQAQVPNFATPQAPRATNLTQPNIPTTTSAKTTPVVRNSGFASWFEWTVDQTKSPVLKAVQGGANLFTGIKKRLGETVKEDESIVTVEKQKKQKKMVTAMLQEWFWEEAITKAFEKLKTQWQFDYNPTISARILWWTANRMEKMQSETERLASEWLDVFSGNVPLRQLSSAVGGYAGQVPATVLDPIASAISPVVQNIIKKTGQTENIQSLATEYEDMAKKYPNLAFWLEGLFNVWTLAPIPKIGWLVKSWTDATLKQLKTIAPKTIDMVTPNLAGWAKKLISQADMWFRKQAEDIAVPKLSEMGMRDKQKVAWNVVETKPWFFKKEELVRSPQEALAIEEVSRMLKEGKIKKWGTELQKSVAINDEISGLAEALKWRLDNTPNQVTIKKAELELFLTDLATNVKKNPIMVWDMQESAFKIIQNIKDKLTKDSYTPSELLEIRKQLDSDIQAFKWDTVFDPKIENAFSSTLKEFRQGLNNKVAELVPDADVRSFLDRQSALYNAKDNVDLKWSKQANSTMGRVLSKVQSATGIPRTEIIELTTALGLLWASSLAPIVAPIAIWATAVVWGKKAIWAILSPKNKVKLASILTKLDEAIKKNPKDPELLRAKKLFTNPNKNGWTTTNILRPSNNWSKPKLIQASIIQSANEEKKPK